MSRMHGFGVAVFTAIFVGELLLPGLAAAQLRDDYKVQTPEARVYVEPNENPTKESKAKDNEKRALQREMMNFAKDVLRSGSTLAADQQPRFQNWFLKYEIPMMTVTTPEALKELPEARKRIVRDYLRFATNEAARTLLVNLLFTECSKIAVDDYHPAVRYNAMLIIGELNDKEMVQSGGAAAPPDPMLKALPFMLEQYESKDQIDPVRLAALIGIQRHMQIEAQNKAKQPAAKIPPQLVQRITRNAMDLVQTPQAPAGRSEEGHDWMRRRAVEILGWVAATRIDQQIVDELIARVGDSEEYRGVRSDAALALGTVMWVPDPQRPAAGAAPVSVKPKEVAAEMAKFIVEMVNGDIDRVETYIEAVEEAKQLYGGGAGGYGGMEGGSDYGGSGGSYGGLGGYGASGRPKRGEPRTRTQAGGIGGGYPGGLYPGAGYPGSSSSGSAGAQKAPDPYAYRVEPVYRKLRHEITCVMRGLRGYDDYRKTQDVTAGLMSALKGTKTEKEDKDFCESIAVGLHAISQKLRVKEDELDTLDFRDETDKDKGVKYEADKLEKLARSSMRSPPKTSKKPAAVAAKPGAKKRGAPADEVPDPAGELPAETAAPAEAAPKGRAPAAAPAVPEPTR